MARPSIVAQGTATAPAAGANIVDLGIFPQSVEQFHIKVYVAMTGTAEPNTLNLTLYWSDGTHAVTIPCPPGNSVFIVPNYVTPSDGVTHVKIKAAGAATAGAIYTVSAVADESGTDED